jgi:hypothetical protein
LGLFITYRLILSRNWLGFFLFLIIPAIVGYVWIFFSHGSLMATYNYYLGTSSNQNIGVARRFLGGRFYIPAYQYPMIFVTFILTAMSFKKMKNDQLAVMSLLFIVLFYLLLHESGGYSAIIIVFYYILIAIGAKYAKKQRLAFSMMLLILLLNSLIFLFKTTTILLHYNERNPTGIEQFVNQNVPPGSVVAGDDRYYYAFIKNGCSFQFINRIGNLEARAQYHKNELKAQFIMLSIETDKEIVKAYREAFIISDEVHYTIKDSDSFMKRIVKSMNPIKILGTYEGVLLVVNME